MTDEMIDLGSIQFRGRTGRKTKYQHKIWEASSPKDKAKYALIMSKNWDRRKAAGKVNGDENPYTRMISDRHRYEIEMEEVFHVDPESIEDIQEIDDDEVIVDEQVIDYVSVPSQLNAIVNIRISNGFAVLCPFQFDDTTNQFFSRVPSGVVNKKMSLSEIYDQFERFTLSSAFLKMKDRRKKVILPWMLFVRQLIEQVEVIEEIEIMEEENV